MSEILIVFFLILCHIVACFTILDTNTLSGDLDGFPLRLSSFIVITMLILIIIGYIVLILFYRKYKDKKIFLFKNYRLKVNSDKLLILMFFTIIAQFIFFLKTGVGKVGGDATSPVSFVFAMFNVNSIFGLFYFLCRKSKKKWLYVLNIILFSVLQLLKGWSSFMLLIFFFEIYFYFRRNPIKSIVNYTRLLTLPVIAILIGGKIYQYVHAYKNLVRFNSEIENTYFDGVTLLLSRLSFFPVSVGAFQNSERVEKLYNFNFVLLRDIQSLFRPLTPGFLMPDKDFRIIGNLVIQSYHPEVSSFTSSNFGLFNYLHILFTVSIFDFIAYILTAGVLIILVKSLFDSLESYRGELNFLFFILLLNVYEVSTLEMVFGYGILPIVFFIPIFLVFKIVVFQRR